MEFKKKTIIWEDNNEPPKDYIGAKKDGKFYEYSYATRSWIESKLIKTEESGGSDGGDTPSGDITIDDVVKFIHDDLVKNGPPFISEIFPYTTWDDIPDYDDVNDGAYCKTNDDNGKIFRAKVLSIPNYVIGAKESGGGGGII